MLPDLSCFTAEVDRRSELSLWPARATLHCVRSPGVSARGDSFLWLDFGGFLRLPTCWVSLGEALGCERPAGSTFFTLFKTLTLSAPVLLLCRESLDVDRALAVHHSSLPSATVRRTVK